MKGRAMGYDRMSYRLILPVVICWWLYVMIREHVVVLILVEVMHTLW